MDRIRPRKRFPLKWILGIAAAAALAAVFVYQILVLDTRPAAGAGASGIRIATVIKGEFQEYFQANAFVVSARSVFIDAREHGVVRAVNAAQGNVVRPGQVLVTLANDELESRLPAQDAVLKNAAADLRNVELRTQQTRLRHRRELLDLDHRIYETNLMLARRELPRASDLISPGELKRAENELQFLMEQWRVLLKSQAVELALLSLEADKVRNTIGLLALERRRFEDRIRALTVVSPAYGQITAFSASVGETKNPGARIAQLDSMEELKLKAVLDEYFLPKVAVGHQGAFTYVDSRGDEREGAATVSWVSPEVKGNAFEADFRFDQPIPSLRIGQRFIVRVELGRKRPAVLLEQGPFFQHSGAGSVYVVDASGAAAVKRPIVVGRTNPDFIEILSGLAAGDRVVVSDYSGFRDQDRISLK